MNVETLKHVPSADKGGDPVLVKVTDFSRADGWKDPARSGERCRWCCEQLEAGHILLFPELPYDFPEPDRRFLLEQRQQDGRLHKNISYRPRQDVLRGSVETRKEETARLHAIMKRFSGEVTRFLGRVLEPYADRWTLDFASYRPEEERGRNLPVHKRNDLLHFDAFPTRPMRGNRILRCFTNINPAEPRVWRTTDGFDVLAEKFARDAGLDQWAQRNGKFSFTGSVAKLLGLKTANRSAYDHFMLGFHDYLKDNTAFQEQCRKIEIPFAPQATWMCFTDSVPHAVMSGRFALEQTFIIPVDAMLSPAKSPIRILERIAERPLA
jgi:hypothetical protein